MADQASRPGSRLSRRRLLQLTLLGAAGTAASLLGACQPAPAAQPTAPPPPPSTPGGAPTAPPAAKPARVLELRWAAQKHPALDFAFERAQVWAQQTGKARVVQAPISYEVFVDKLSAELLLDHPNVDITWYNDDWGQLWGQHLEPVDDIKAIREKTHKTMYDPFWIWDGKLTGVPFLETLQTFFIRKDLIDEKEVLEWDWNEFVERAKAAQQTGQVKWGFVGGMKYPHTWFTWLWAVWSNNCDIYLPKYERDNKVLEQNGWKSGLREHCWIETAQFWWDNINTHKISPPGMPGYTRTDADAIFMAGDAAIINQDSPLYGDYTNPQKSKIHDKVGFAGFPVGPSGDQRTGHRAPWGFAIPKNAEPEKKAVAKELLEWLLVDEETQTQLWKKTGGVPPNLDVQKKLADTDETFNRLVQVTGIGAPKVVLPAYYFPQWPQAHSTLSDALGKVITSRPEDWPRIFEETAAQLEKIPKG